MKRSLSVSSSAASYVTAEDEAAEQRQEPARVDSLARRVSPPPTRGRPARSSTLKSARTGASTLLIGQTPTTAQVEAGASSVDDHVEFFSARLAAFNRSSVSGPRLPHLEWVALYSRNQTSQGHHFVIHQHDHPVAGTHYDLRLQINATSSISFAIMYGLPGDPNSRRLNRNATETRVHCLWVGSSLIYGRLMADVAQNHLIETASSQTGTMLIWDTGEYEILDKSKNPQNSYNSESEAESEGTLLNSSDPTTVSQPGKLAMAFSQRKIRLRLHGTRLPQGYTLYLRLTKDNDRSTQPKAPAYRRRRKLAQEPSPKRARRASTSSILSSSSATSSSRPNSEASVQTRSATHRRLRRTVSSLKRTASPPRRTTSKPMSRLEPIASEIAQPADPALNVMAPTTPRTKHAPGDERAATLAVSHDDSDETIRRNNAYLGASNTVGSIHQRKWYISLDRELSGFKPIPTPSHINHHAKTYWVQQSAVSLKKPPDNGPVRTAPGFERFHVLGRDHERSVVTGRLASEILVDEHVEGYVPRGLWRPVLE